MKEGSITVKGDTVYVNPSGSSFVYEYDSVRDKWINKIQCGRIAFGLLIVDELLTLVGGQILDSSSYTSSGIKSDSSDDESASEVTSSLISLYTEPIPEWVKHFNPVRIRRWKVVVCCTPNHVVVAGGYLNAFKKYYHWYELQKCLEVEVMDIETKEWKCAQSIPKCSQQISSAVFLGNAVYFCCNSRDVASYSSVLTCTLPDLLQSCNPNHASKVIQPLIWQKLKPLSELHKPFLAHFCGNLVALGGQKKAETYYDDFESQRHIRYSFLPAIYAYDHVKGWISLGYLPRETGFPRLNFVVANLLSDKMVVCGGRSESTYADDDTDFVCICSLRS